MALVLHDGPMSSNQIFDWIQKAFPYYEAFGLPDDKESEFLHPAFYDYELRAKIVTHASAFRDCPWSISVSEADPYLRRVLKLGPQTSFPFLSLPAELRKTIYAMVLTLPPSGVAITSIYSNQGRERGTFALATQDFKRPFSMNSCRGIDNVQLDDYYQQPAQRQLALLLVNKQIFEEAHAIFYGQNLFFFDCVNEMDLFLRRLPLHRKKHLTQVTFTYRIRDYSAWQSAFHHLGPLERLRTLHIYIHEERWEDRMRHVLHVPADVLKIPGMEALRGLRGLEEVSVLGEYRDRFSPPPRLPAYLKPEMLKPKVVTEDTHKHTRFGQKTNAKDEEDEEGGDDADNEE